MPNAKQYHSLLGRGICVTCATRPSMEGHVRCQHCRDRYCKLEEPRNCVTCGNPITGPRLHTRAVKCLSCNPPYVIPKYLINLADTNGW